MKKRKCDDSSEIITPRKRYRHHTDNSLETHKKDLKTIKDAIKHFFVCLLILSPDMVQEKCFYVKEYPYSSRK